MISTRDLSRLPDIDTLKRRWQSLAMMDAILSPEWESRYYSFNAHWHPGEEMGSMRDGSGDDLFALFNRSGCFLKGFAHEAVMSPYGLEPTRVWPGVLDAVPVEFAACLVEPAFAMQHTTFCIWRRYGDENWQRGQIEFPENNDADGSADLLSALDGLPETYQEWAEYHYGHAINLNGIRHIYGQRPLTPDLIAALNPALTIDDLLDDIREIGYPH